MTRLLVVVRSFECGGAERQLIELLKRIDKTRLEVSVISLYPGGSLWREVASIPDISVHHLGKKARWDITVLSALWRRMREFRPNIVHGYGGAANLLALIGKLMGAKVVWGIRASKLDAFHYDYLSRIMLWTEWLLSRLPDLIICNSEAAQRQLTGHGYPVGRTVVIPNGIDVQRFRADPMLRSSVRAEWAVTSGEFLVGLVARLDPMKGHSVFLRAASEVAARHPELRFVLVGDGPAEQRKALHELAEQLELNERLIWAGERHDMPAVMSALDLCISASLFGEGFSNAVGESMSCGVPCVVTDVGDSARIVGNLGWVVEPGDAHGLAEQISRAMHVCRGSQFRPDEARLRIEREFSVEKLAETTAAALCALPG